MNGADFEGAAWGNPGPPFYALHSRAGCGMISAGGMMVKIIRKETRRRGFFGWVFLLIFLAFNAFMTAWMVAVWNVGGTGLSSGIATAVLLFVWAAGAIVTGLLALLTRGRRTIIEETVE